MTHKSQPNILQEKYPIIIITGLSGSGKSTALRALEDIGFFCVDNLPIQLLHKFLQLRAQVSQDDLKVALVMDVRTKDFLSRHASSFRRLRKEGYILHLLFLEAQDDILIRRFSQTRRQHPLAESEPIIKALQDERERLEELRKIATRVIDTSRITGQQLREIIMEEYSRLPADQRLNLHIISFGFKYGLPPEADIVMDVRFLPNPYFVPGLSELSGNDPGVKDFVLGRSETLTFLERFFPMLDYLIPNYQKEGKVHLSIAIGCSGGHHRSVVIANTLKEHLSQYNYPLTLNHRDITKE